jgi:hypothetical protein
MNTIKFLFSLLIVLLVYSNFAQAQQDYKTVQNFKARYQRIETDIKSADSLAQLIQLESTINQFESDYSANKSLFDKSLYPDDFNTSFEKLRKELAVRKTDFTQITALSTQVTDLNLQIDDLNKNNSLLLIQIRDLTEQSKVDKNKISQLEKTIYALRSSLRKRDELVMDMIDSLMPADLRNKGTLTNQEKQNIFSESQKKNILENIRRAIQENIRFLQVTSLKPDDIKTIKEKQQAFEKTWQSFGPKLIKIYSARHKNVSDAQKIDSAFTAWDTAITMEAWDSINNDFSNLGINLNKFTSGTEFTDVLTKYIRDEIKNAEIKVDSSKKDYEAFVDSAWFGNIKPIWVPYLIDNNMLSEAQKDTIETNIAKWKEVVNPGGSYLLYIAIALFILIFVVVVVIVKRKPKKKPVFEDEESETSEPSEESKPE